MKRILLIFVILGAHGAFAQAGTATKIAVSGFNPWPAGTPTCSASVTANCQSGFTLTITPPTGAAIVEQIPAGATTYTYTSPAALSYGAYSLSMVTKGSDSTGTVGTSTATIVPATYAPTITVIPAPGGFTVLFQ